MTDILKHKTRKGFFGKGLLGKEFSDVQNEFKRAAQAVRIPMVIEDKGSQGIVVNMSGLSNYQVAYAWLSEFLNTCHYRPEIVFSFLASATFNELLPVYVACSVLVVAVIALFCPSRSKEVKQQVSLSQVAKYYTPQQLAKELLNNNKFRFSETDEEREKVCKYVREQVAKRSVLSVALNPMDVGGADVHIWDGGKATVVTRDKNWLNASKELKETLSLIHSDRSVQAQGDAATSNSMAKLTDATGGPCKHYVLGEVTANFSQHNFVVAAHGNMVESFTGNVKGVEMRNTLNIPLVNFSPGGDMSIKVVGICGDDYDYPP